MTSKYYVAVRKCQDNGHEWLDIYAMSGLLEESQRLAERVDRATGPCWAKDNPVIRYAHCELTES